MAKRRRRAPSPPPPPPPVSGVRKMISYTITAIALFVAFVGFASAVIAFLPRMQIDAAEAVDPQSPLPSSITITNGLLPLKDVSIFVRIGAATSSEGTGKITGFHSAGGITTPQWQNRQLATDEKWAVPMGTNVPFIFNVGTADVVVAVTYWPKYIPRLFFSLPEKLARLVIHRLPNGASIWIVQPLN